MSEEKTILPSLPAEAVIQQLEGKCSEYEATIADLRERIESGNRQLVDEKFLNESRLGVIHDLEKQLESKNAKIDSMQKDLEMCIRQRNTAESQYAELCSEKKQLEELAAGQASDIESLRERVADRTKDVQYYHEENKKLEARAIEAENKAEDLEKALHQIIQANSQIAEDAKAYRTKYEAVCDSVTELLGKILKL